MMRLTVQRPLLCLHPPRTHIGERAHPFIGRDLEVVQSTTNSSLKRNTIVWTSSCARRRTIVVGRAQQKTPSRGLYRVVRDNQLQPNHQIYTQRGDRKRA